MCDVIFARPQQLDRGIDALGDPGRFHQIVVLKSPAEAASRAHHVSRDVALLNSKRLGYQSAAVDWQSAGGPHFQLSVFPVCRGSLRLERDMREEWVLVSGVHYLDR